MGTVCVQGSSETEDGVGSSETGGCWELNLGPPQEQKALWSTLSQLSSLLLSVLSIIFMTYQTKEHKNQDARFVQRKFIPQY